MTAAKRPEDYLKSASLGLVLQKKLKELNTNPRRFSAQIGYAYDHVRKIYNGSEFPGKTLLKKICDALELNYEEMLALVEADKGFVKGWNELVLDEDPKITEIKRHWAHLTDNDKQDIMELVKIKALRAAKGKN